MEWERFCNGLCYRAIPLQRICNDRPLICDGCYRKLPIWEVTTVVKYDIQGLRGGKLSDRITKGCGISIGTAQLSGPGVISGSFREQIKCFHNLLRKKPSSLFMLKGLSTTSIASLTMRSMYLVLLEDAVSLKRAKVASYR
jgi:hypothetical protein